MAGTCDHCGKTSETELKACARCRSARYCSAECQKVAWKGGHKTVCVAPVVPAATPSQNAVPTAPVGPFSMAAHRLKVFDIAAKTSWKQIVDTQSERVLQYTRDRMPNRHELAESGLGAALKDMQSTLRKDGCPLCRNPRAKGCTLCIAIKDIIDEINRFADSGVGSRSLLRLRKFVSKGAADDDAVAVPSGGVCYCPGVKGLDLVLPLLLAGTSASTLVCVATYDPAVATALAGQASADVGSFIDLMVENLKTHPVVTDVTLLADSRTSGPVRFELSVAVIDASSNAGATKTHTKRVVYYPLEDFRRFWPPEVPSGPDAAVITMVYAARVPLPFQYVDWNTELLARSRDGCSVVSDTTSICMAQNPMIQAKIKYDNKANVKQSAVISSCNKLQKSLTALSPLDENKDVILHSIKDPRAGTYLHVLCWPLKALQTAIREIGEKTDGDQITAEANRISENVAALAAASVVAANGYKKEIISRSMALAIKPLLDCTTADLPVGVERLQLMEAVGTSMW